VRLPVAPQRMLAAVGLLGEPRRQAQRPRAPSASQSARRLISRRSERSRAIVPSGTPRTSSMGRFRNTGGPCCFVVAKCGLARNLCDVDRGCGGVGLGGRPSFRAMTATARPSQSACLSRCSRPPGRGQSQSTCSIAATRRSWPSGASPHRDLMDPRLWPRRSQRRHLAPDTAGRARTPPGVLDGHPVIAT